MPTKSKSNVSHFSAGDIVFILFRYKWRILFGTFLGIAAAAGLYFWISSSYVSEAKILVRYVADRAGLTPASRDENIRVPDSGGQSIIASEIQILTSRDLADQVVKAVGAERILEKLGGGSDPAAATAHVLKNLTPEIPARSSVIALSYEHPDPVVAQAVLTELVRAYIAKHLEVHNSVGAYEFLDEQTRRLQLQLTSTEARLHAIRTNAGMVSIDKEQLTAEITKLRGNIMHDEAELEARRAVLPLATVARAKETTTNAPAESRVSPQDLALYKSLVETLDGLRAKEIEMLARYTENNPVVIGVRSQISELSRKQKAMEAAAPGLATALIPRSPGIASAARSEAVDPAAEVPALEARLRVLKTQYDRLLAQADTLERAGTEMTDLQRTKLVQEDNYRAFATSLERARIDQAIDSSKQTSISVVQSPSRGIRNPGRRAKPVAATAAGGLVFGLLLALLSEFVTNPTVKRPSEFRGSPVPLMITIPMLANGFGRRKSLNGSSGVAKVDMLPLISDQAHPIRPYFDAIRDRLLVQFDGIIRKPKLVGVTCCSKGAGGSAVAAGVAAALSETGDGNVLLVDLNFEHGSAHQFFKGRPVCALTAAVEEEKRGQGLLQENLYLASINEAEADTSKVPSKRIAEIMPKLRASDYDYIIFDMPPLSDTSVTFRMSALMDKVLLVVDSEKTPRAALRHATGLLGRARANAEAVLNRQRRYAPSLLEDFAGAQ